MIKAGRNRVSLVSSRIRHPLVAKPVLLEKPTKTTKVKIAAGKLTSPSPYPYKGEGGKGINPLEEKIIGEKKEVEEMKRKIVGFSDPTKKILSDFLLLELKSKQKISTSSQRDVEMWISSVLKALKATLKSAPASISQKNPLWDAFEVSYSELATFLVEAGISGLQSYQRQSLYDLLAKLLVAHSAKLAGFVGTPLSPKFICGQTHMIPGLFDNAWPGYLSAGLAMRVVQSLSALEKR